eukprot:364575-Chlamydomonas_euryale.AAC.1
MVGQEKLSSVQNCKTCKLFRVQNCLGWQPIPVPCMTRQAERAAALRQNAVKFGALEALSLFVSPPSMLCCLSIACLRSMLAWCIMNMRASLGLVATSVMSPIVELSSAMPPTIQCTSVHVLKDRRGQIGLRWRACCGEVRGRLG